MTRIESTPCAVNLSAQEAFAFFSEIHNLGRILPEQVEGFKAEQDECTFTIKGMATLGLKIQTLQPYSAVVFASHGKVPFPFTLRIDITTTGPDKCSVQLLMDADMNPMLKMLAERPLGNFLNMLCQRFASLHQS
jgi:carbon monoxide dehydrogenase subunit G